MGRAGHRAGHRPSVAERLWVGLVTGLVLERLWVGLVIVSKLSGLISAWCGSRLFMISFSASKYVLSTHNNPSLDL